MRRLSGVFAALAMVSCASSPSMPPPTVPPPPCPSAAPNASTASAPAPSAFRNVEEAKDRVLALFSAGDAEGLRRVYDPAMQQAFSLESTAAFVQQVLAAKGVWHKATREPGPASDRHGVWLVLADRGTWTLELTLDESGLVAGLSVTQPAPAAPPVARSDVPLSLPFRGEWYVTWGGDSRAVNHHVDAPDQRRAADLLVIGPDHRTFRGDGRSNEDYFVYGQEVLAAADGAVETVVDGVPENTPHEENHYVLPGNYVVLRHGPRLYSVYMHLQPGKIRVKPGQAVRRGEVIGLAGNSGHSTEPHLHFQLQDGPDGNRAWGIEPVFDRVVVTRAGATQTVSGYTFLKGDRIRAP